MAQVILIAGALAALAYILANSPANALVSLSNNALRDGSDWQGVVRAQHLWAEQAGQMFNSSPALLLAIIIHESRGKSSTGGAGEIGAAQILPSTLKVLLAKYPQLQGKNPGLVKDAYFFAAAHLKMTAEILGLPQNSKRNILAYNRGAVGARNRNPDTEPYSVAVYALYRAIMEYTGE